MSTNVGTVNMALLLNSNPFNNGLKNAASKIKSSGIENSLKKIGKMALTAFSVTAVVNFGKECINLGSDLAEVQNVVDVTFGNLNTEVNKFAENAIAKFGLGQTVTKKYVGTFGAMAKSFNFSNKEALAMSETLTGLTGDVASFYNLSSDAAYTKIKSVFTGETESLKELGVVMTQNALDQYALANGYGKTTAKMSEQEKVALRYKFVMDKLSVANGDFERTSDGWANQTRVLSLRFNELKATLGQGFINVFTPIVKGINIVLSKLQVLANAFKSFTEMIFGNAGDNGSSTVSNLADEATNASENISGIGDSAKKAAKDMKSLATFDTAQILKSDKDEGTSGGSGASTGLIDTSSLDLTSGLKNQVSDIENILNGVNFEPLKASLENLRKAISFFGEGCGKILGGFYNNFLVPLRNYVISDALPHFFNSTADAIKQIEFEKITNSFDELWKSLEPFAENIGDGLLWFYDKVLLPLGLWTINDVLPVFLDILSGALDIVNKAIEDIKPIWEWFWDNVLQPLISWTGGAIVEDLKGIGEALKIIIDNEFAMSIIEGVAIAIGLVTGALALYNIAVGICNGVTWLFNGALAVLTSPITLVIAAIAGLVAGIILLIKNWDKVKEVAINCWSKITQTFSNIGSWFSNKFQEAYNGITKVFNNIGNFFGNVWNKIKNTFSDLGTKIGDAMSGAVKSGINGVLGMVERTVNKFVNMINGAIGIINNIPGVNISKLNTLNIPRLAQGGYVKANTPQLAMIGDNRHQGEIVAPEDKLMSLYKKANQEMGLGNNSKVIELLSRIIQLLENMDFDFKLYIDSYELLKRLEQIKNKKKFATNGG